MLKRTSAIENCCHFKFVKWENMRGFVNYYIDEDEDNYRVVRGDTDVYKFKLDKTQVCQY